MVRPYSLDLRQRVLAALASGATCRAVAERFAVSVSTVVKWSQRMRLTGSAAPARIGGSKPYVLISERDWLLARIGEKPDITLRAVMAELAERGVRVSVMAVFDFYRREGFTFKKNAARQRTRSS